MARRMLPGAGRLLLELGQGATHLSRNLDRLLDRLDKAPADGLERRAA